ncbi:type II secretion system protein [Patescibacteria group bacterium]
MFRIKKIRAFTLIELLVVITIIGILSVLVVVNIQESRAKARNSKRKSDLHTISSALESYYADYNGYPFGEGLRGLDGIHYVVRNVASSYSSWYMQCNDLPEMLDGNNNVWRDLCEDAGGGWLWELASKGYIDRAPNDPLNFLASGIDYDGYTVLNNIKPGFTYFYFNDEPNYGYDPNEPAECSQPTDSTLGHGQRYTLWAGMERPHADRDWIGDGGAYPPNSDVYGTYILSLREVRGADDENSIDLGGIEIGQFYEVFSSGGNTWSGQFIVGDLAIGMDDLWAEDCY